MLALSTLSRLWLILANNNEGKAAQPRLEGRYPANHGQITVFQHVWTPKIGENVRSDVFKGSKIKRI